MPGAAIYARISRDRAGGGLGVDRQEADCRDLARRLGLTISGRYVDNDLSAFSGKKRPQYELLLADVQAGQVTAILAWHPDRLHRSPRELERFIDVVEAARVDVHTCTAGDVDLTTASGRMVARIVGAVARHESEHKSERIRRKHLELADAGMPNGGLRRFGFEPDNMTVREPEAKIVREFCLRLIAGDSVNSICNDIIRRGIPTVQNAVWTPSLVRQVVLRPRNAGLRLRKGQEHGPAVWPAIVPEETWRAACAIIKDPARRKSFTNVRRHLLTNLATCGVCGSRIKAKGYKKPGMSVYACVESCVARKTTLVDAYVVGAVLERLSDPRLAAALRPHASTERDYSLQTAALRARMKEAAKLYARGAIDTGTLEEIRRDIDDQLDKLAEHIPMPSPIDGLTGTPDEIEARWEALSIERKRSVIAHLLTIKIVPVTKRGPAFDPGAIILEPR